MNSSNDDEFYEVSISPINSKTFSTYFDDDFRLVKEHEFRRAVFRSIFMRPLFLVSFSMLTTFEYECLTQKIAMT